MRRQRATVVLAAGTVAAALVTGCAGPVEPPAPSHVAGTVSLPTCTGMRDYRTPKTRVAATEPGVLDTIIALGAAERIVARSGTSVSAGEPANEPALVSVPDVGPSVPSTEGLIGAQPDLVVQVRSYHLDPAQGGADAAAVQASGAQVYPTRSACSDGLDLAAEDDLDGVLADITNIGALLGVPDRAHQLTTRLRTSRDRVVAQVAARPRVPGVQLTIVGGQLYATSGGLTASLLDTAGMENLFPDPSQAYVPVSPEIISARNPQAISLISFPTSGGEAEQIGYLQRTFPTTDAVRTGRIAVLDAHRAGPATPATFDGLAELAHFLHPQAVPAPPG